MTKLKVVLAGCGGIANAWLGPVKEFGDIDIVGLVDINLANAEKVKAKFELTNAVVGVSVGEVIDQTQPDAVFDCTIPEAHAAVTIEALKRGCHVLGEKPMAENMEKARQMIAAVRENGKTYAVIQNRRYNDSIICFRETVQSGQIGELTTLNADFYLGPRFGGFRDAMQHVLVLDMAIHSFDEARFISGTDPVSVYCHEWNPRGSWYTHGASAIAIFEMSNGVVFTYRGSWCAEGLPTSWECEWRAIGSEGTAKWDGFESVAAQRRANNEGFFRQVQDVECSRKSVLPNVGHKALIREFVDCVRNGGVPQTVCTDNIKSLAMVHAAIKSAELGRKVNVEY